MTSINEHDNTESIPIETNHKWENLNLKNTLVKGIYSVGFENPSFIQKKAIPVIAEGKDLRAQAQSGTGKTGAFVIGTLQRIDDSLDATQAIVLASTREIASQNYEKFIQIGAYTNTRTVLLLGGSSTKSDLSKLTVTPHIIVGTPGRINAILDMGAIKVDKVSVFVLDEADEMLKAGFEEQVRDIYSKVCNEAMQVLLFSATYNEADLALIRQIIKKEAVEIDLRLEDQTLKGIKQLYVNVGRGTLASQSGRDSNLQLKVATMIDIFKTQTLAQVLIFINRKQSATMVYDLLNANGYPCELMTSDLDQTGRNQVLDDFKSGKTRILVSSGLCKRGVDVQSLSIVVCLDVPSEADKSDYIHRVGRSGRYGRKGVALHILNATEVVELENLAKQFNSVIFPLETGYNLSE